MKEIEEDPDDILPPFPNVLFRISFSECPFPNVLFRISFSGKMVI